MEVNTLIRERIMKNIKQQFTRLTIQGSLILILLASACDSGFEEMNKNPNAFTDPVIGSLFSYNLIRTAGSSDDNTLYPNDKLAGAMMQIFASLNPYQWTGDKYLKKAGYTDGLFNAVFGVELKENVQILTLTKDDPQMVNYYNIARIWHVYIMHRATDMYGDVPYFEAGQGYTEGIYKPKFDKQEDIYADMLKELDEAAKNLDPSKPSFGSADYLYGGDVAKWKTFAYSMMLRLGLRLTKVDLTLSETWVKKAIAGGVMQSNADIAKLNHSSGGELNYYWDGRELQGGEGVPPSEEGRGYGKMAQTFVSHLKDTKDPRLPFYITLWPGNADPTLLPTSTNPADQKGLPSGYDASSIKSIIPDWTDDSYAAYSEINLHTVAHDATPSIFLSYNEVKLYLAEAALRGWDSGDPKTYYEEAVTASMKMGPLYPGSFSIPQAAIDQYLVDNPYTGGTFEEQMEQIHTQFWVSQFMNNMEIFANWRRTGYPKLTPTNYPGNETGGTIPRRIPYPQSEASINTENYKAAIDSQGPDLWTTRIWWDKE
jgi:hypothetical protein